jgi:hypothetical protein
MGPKNCFDSSSYKLRFSRGFWPTTTCNWFSLKTLLFLMAPLWLAHNFDFFRSLYFSKEKLVKHHTVCDYNSQLLLFVLILVFSTRCRHVCPYGEAVFFDPILTIGEESPLYDTEIGNERFGHLYYCFLNVSIPCSM